MTVSEAFLFQPFLAFLADTGQYVGFDTWPLAVRSDFRLLKGRPVDLAGRFGQGSLQGGLVRPVTS